MSDKNNFNQNNFIPAENIKQLISDIKEKKELKELSADFVREHLFQILNAQPKLTQELISNFNPRSSAYKTILKNVRAKLRRVYGLFRVEKENKDRKNLFKELLISPQPKWNRLIINILETHSSTKERLPFYKQLYPKIFKISGKPKTIIDLGAGINPFSLSYLNLNELNYYAYDLSEEEVEMLNKFFGLIHTQNKEINAQAAILDLMNFVKLKELIKADVCFLFKMTDVLDRGQGHKTSEIIISNIPASYVVVSFPTLTMSGKKMNHPRRKWIELMSQRLGYDYKILEFSNEIFYILKK